MKNFIKIILMCFGVGLLVSLTYKFICNKNNKNTNNTNQLNTNEGNNSSEENERDIIGYNHYYYLCGKVYNDDTECSEFWFKFSEDLGLDYSSSFLFDEFVQYHYPDGDSDIAEFDFTVQDFDDDYQCYFYDIEDSDAEPISCSYVSLSLNTSNNYCRTVDSDIISFYIDYIDDVDYLHSDNFEYEANYRNWTWFLTDSVTPIYAD